MISLFSQKNKIIKEYIGISIFALLFFSIFYTARAQGLPSVIGGLELTPSTSSPAPGQTVTITAQSFSSNINSAKTTWSVGGKVLQSGTGLTKLDIVAPVLGQKKTVLLTIVTSEGQTISKSIDIIPGSIDMIVETNGYKPPLFLGKLSPVYQNEVKIIAIPHIAINTKEELDPNKLVYQWKKNDQVLQSQSGFGKNFVTVSGDIIPRPYIVTVTASTQDGRYSSTGAVNITESDPQISFYINDPLYGILFNKIADNNIRIDTNRRVNVLSVPYGFNPNTDLSNIVLDWIINGESHQELAKSTSVVLRAPEGKAGYSNIQLQISNTEKLLQRASSGFSTTFTANKSSVDNNVTF